MDSCALILQFRASHAQLLCLVRLLPSCLRVHEVAVVADLCEEWFVQIQCADHASRSEIKDAADSFGQECVVIVSALLRVDLDGNRLCLPNGIGEADRTHIGKTGGIGRLPIVIPTVQIMLNKNKFPAGFGEKSRQFWLAQFDRALNIVKTAEKGIPAATWEDFPAESIPKYAVMYREARLEIAKQGIYNKTTLNVMKKARCSVNPTDAECATPREID